jgi:hypothetical protein
MTGRRARATQSKKSWRLKISRRSTACAAQSGSSARRAVARGAPTLAASVYGCAPRCAGKRSGARRGQRAVEAVVEADEAAQPEREHVRGLQWIGVVVGELETGDHDQAVAGCGPLGLRLERGEVGLEARRGDSASRRAVNVVGNGKDVEPGAAVQIHERTQVERAVAPGRVSVKLAEQWARYAGHRVDVRRRTCGSGLVHRITTAPT